MDESKLGYYIPELVDAREKTLSGRIAELEALLAQYGDDKIKLRDRITKAIERIAGLEALLRDVVREDDKFDVCITEGLRDRIDEALLGKGRPVPPHGSGP